jgi:hypothetical protein
MSNITIPNLPAVISLNGSELLLGVQSNASVKITTGQIVSLATGASGNLPFPVSIGGTGNSTLTQYGLLYGNGTSPIGAISPPAGTDYVLVGSAGSVPTWQPTIPVTAGVDSVAFGTTGLTPVAATAGVVSIAFGSVPTAAGIYSPAANQIALSTSSTRQLLISSTGAATFTTSVTSPLLTATASRTATSTTGAINYGTLGYSDTNVLESLQTNVNSYAQLVLQNTSNGATASADITISNDAGTASTNYANFGINSSGFTGTGSLSQPNNVYLTSASSDLVIGTLGSNAIRFVVNNGATDAMTISAAGVVTIPNAEIIQSSLTTPIVYGGTTASSSLTLQSTSGAGTTDNIIFKTGNAGATTALTIGTGTSANFTFGGTAQRFLADFSNATVSNRFSFQTSTTNATTGIYALPNGSSTAASWQATNNADPTNASKILIATNGTTDVQLVSGINGTGTYLPLSIFNGGLGRFVFGTAGQFGIGPIGSVSYGTAGQVLVSGGASAAPSWSSTTAFGATVITATSVNAFAVGQNGVTNPAFNIDTSTASSATGVNIKSAAAGAGVALSVLSSGAAENLTIDAKGSGTIVLGTVSTGNVGIGTTSPAGKLSVAASNNGILISGTAGTSTSLYIAGNGNTAGSTSFDLYQDDSSNGVVYNRANAPLIFGTNSTERMRIAAAGNIISNSGIYENVASIASAYTTTAGNNAMSAGPLVISAIVVVSTSSNWVVL